MRTTSQKMEAIAYAVMGILVTLILVFPWERDKRQSVNKEADKKTIVCLGDSVMGNVRDETGIIAMLARQTGTIVYNCAIGGTSAASLNTGLFEDYYYDFFSLENMSRVIAYQDDTTVRIDGQQEVLFPKAAEEVGKLIAQIDFSRIDCIIVNFGLNDYMCGVPIRSTDRYDRYTFEGALRSSVERMQKSYPDLKIILLSPIYCRIWENGTITGSEEKDFGGGVLPDYVESVKSIAEEYGTYYLDNYEGLGWNISNESLYLLDGIHPNMEGRVLFTHRLAEYICENVLFEERGR